VVQVAGILFKLGGLEDLLALDRRLSSADFTDLRLGWITVAFTQCHGDV
jgi:hypothetical protein